LSAFILDRRLPSSVFGPVLFFAFSLAAAILLGEVMIASNHLA
jgi:hypothetical protein